MIEFEVSYELYSSAHVWQLYGEFPGKSYVSTLGLLGGSLCLPQAPRCRSLRASAAWILTSVASEFQNS